MNLKKLKKIGAVALALAMMAPAAIQVMAATAENDLSVNNTIVSRAIEDADKEPRQLNVHVGEDAATSVNVTYTTVAETKTMISLQKADGTGETIHFTGDSTLGQGGKYIHKITVTGLEPFTEYNYTVGDENNTYNGTFKTALAQGDTTSFTFAYLADTQVSNATNAKALGATLAEVDAMDPDFVFLAGDQTDTNNNEKQWEWFFNNDGVYPTGGEDLFASHTLAITQGNHDNDEMYGHINAPAEAGEKAGKIVYSFDYGTVKFIVLNLEAARYSDDARAEQEAYLREAVADAKANGQWTIVGFHKSIYTGASHITDGDIIAARTFWSPIFAELDVDIVLQGHDHVYARGFVTADGQNANAVQDENGVYAQPENSPLYMVGGHAGALKWYAPKNYTVSEGDPLALNYSFLDYNSGTMNSSATKQEQMITMIEVTNEKISVVNYAFKYDTATDTITTEKYVQDSFAVERATAEIAGTESTVKEDNETLDYTVSFTDVANTNTFETKVTYDETKLEFVGAESLLENGFVYTNAENGVATVRVGVQTPFDAIEKTDIVKYSFKLKEGAGADDVTVTLTSAQAVAYAPDADLDDFGTLENVLITNGEAITDVITYDLNGDGEVTIIDLSYAFKYYLSDNEVCDVNRDGVVDNLDFSIINSYID